MSYIGKNIRKIRLVKKLNQQAFAELFGLSRANIGSYEEGRAEPKIGVIMDIAKKFSLDVEGLLNRELNVNEISRFKGGLETNPGKESILNTVVLESAIPFVSVNNRGAYLTNLGAEDYLGLMPKFEIPNFTHKKARAFEIQGNEMLCKNEGLFESDIVICTAKNAHIISEFTEGFVYCVVLTESLIIRRLFFERSSFVLAADNGYYAPIELQVEQVVEIWEAHTIISSRGGVLRRKFMN